ncbi:MAG: tRNA (adenosine(37)-N6)-threonylcarbamoyltransferase complex dimerization subunit type 1 TsaB [Bdellovibrionaceae bacterium]|nr:tRNA (adenosine(37)-N6)-threonylcarbamoyltransferase complex dimerization subunit type 1 TsaB [Pseudobdellovibrionaceae bacterium]
MHLLCIETSTTQGEIALFHNQNLIALSTWDKEYTHSEILTVKYQELLAQNHFEPQLLTDILVSYGPGSFTGLRVGLNFAKSLGYSYQLPIYLSPSFRGVLAPKTLHLLQQVLILRPALQNRFYVAQYFLDTSHTIVEKVLPETLTLAQIEERFKDVERLNVQGPRQLVTATAWSEGFAQKVNFVSEPERFNYCLNHLHYFTHEKDLIKLEKSDWKNAYPLYIRASEAEEKMKLGDLKVHKKRTL